MLPEEKDVGDLLRRLQTLATQSNLHDPRLQAGADRPEADARGVADQLELDGTYHNLGLFFDRVSKFPRIINVSNVRIKAKDKPQPGSTITASARRRPTCSWKAPAPKAGAAKKPAAPAKKAS